MRRPRDQALTLEADQDRLHRLRRDEGVSRQRRVRRARLGLQATRWAEASRSGSGATAPMRCTIILLGTASGSPFRPRTARSAAPSRSHDPFGYTITAHIIG